MTADKTKLKKLNEEESTLSNAFIAKLLAAAKAAAYVTTDKNALAGLSDAQIAAAALAAKERKLEGYVIPLQNTTQQPDFALLSQRATRQAIFENSWNRAERGGANDTRDTIARMAQIRAEKAKLLGFPNYAAWKLEDQMAKTPEAALKFYGCAGARRDGKSGERSQGHPGGDRRAEGRLPAAAVGLGLLLRAGAQERSTTWTKSQIKPYLELNNVLQNGVFYAANQLYGITFKERKDIPVYHPDVRVFEVFDADRQAAGAVVLRLFQARQQEWRRVDGQPCRSVQTAGHAAGGLQRGQLQQARAGPARADQLRRRDHDVPRIRPRAACDVCRIRSIRAFPAPRCRAISSSFRRSSTSIGRLIRRCSRTTRKITRRARRCPRNLRRKSRRRPRSIRATRSRNCWPRRNSICSGIRCGRARRWKSRMRLKKRRCRRRSCAISYVPPRYRSSYFLHIWGDEYAAGYYAYLWSEMLDDNAFQWFEDHGGLTRANGDRFRQMVLSRGNTEDLAKMYAAWLGEEPSIEPMLKYRGLAQTGDAK